MSQQSEVTRRLWMLQIGEIALGLGAARNLGRTQTTERLALPPGLYEASRDHLGHALERQGRFHPIPAGSPTDYVSPRTGPYKPLFFTPPEFTAIRRVTALILGEEADQNSVVQEVAEWVDLSVFSSAGVREAALRLTPMQRAVVVAYEGPGPIRAVETFDPQKVYRDGLAWLDHESRSRHGARFVDLQQEKQRQFLFLISDTRTDQHLENPGTRFFKLMKADVARGFYTSRAGLRELDFKGNAFYGRSPGCGTRS